MRGRSDSRIPDASFGTAEEDALRRDFTLNSLFYNVNTGKVEDMTGRSDNNRVYHEPTGGGGGGGVEWSRDFLTFCVPQP